jgi:Zn ribbon nucleic-acid-binding protein
MGKAVVSVNCASCGTKYRTIIKKSGKQARVCPSCNSSDSIKNQKEPEDHEELS